ncbi:hypothetical protein CMQ_8242 [Grosmannia clavigera kw1407]|uniref:Uncharacterized protein n=1 Tax=Grosmannia clavigera (strain kw1407 / UAMH 11150) TaxID=655863 RepID=F0XKQ2_GROCL|nr:uncharacterized protein CMQ_8242 [Grosmannia clavigera kw1407]EFX01776.1 hypothetical protein CMQ_8242 [Grosmannia clavigera kw1407]
MTNGTWSMASAQFSAQWTEPSDIFSVLLIVGGDVVLGALMAVVGANRRVSCEPEMSLKAFNLSPGYQRQNQSWLLARLFETYDFWKETAFRQRLGKKPLLGQCHGQRQVLPGK